VVRFPKGDEVWSLYYDMKINNYVPHFEGVVTSVRRDGYIVNGKLIPLGTWPLFGSREACERHIAEHPFAVPTIKP
jgi:hypothetical protein